MTTILVTSAGRRRYVIEALVNTASTSDKVIAADMNPLAPALSVPGADPLIVQGRNVEERMEFLLETIETRRVDAVISLHDFEGIEFSDRTSELEKRGCIFIGPSRKAAQTVLDKARLAEHLSTIDSTLTPLTLSTTVQVSENVGMHNQWVVKDRLGSASSGLAIVTSAELLTEVSLRKKNSWVVQPLVQGNEFNTDVFLDRSNSVAGTCTKQKWAMRGGETDSATVLEESPAKIVDTVTRGLRGLEICGNVDIDILIPREGLPVIIDVNPRFGGGFAFSVVAGYEGARGIWDLAAGRNVEPFTTCRPVTASKYVSVAEVAQ